ncbi:hypothetical protein SHO565_32490 [Streptomyces sp. HO565]
MEWRDGRTPGPQSRPSSRGSPPSRKGAPNIKDLGKLRHVVERTFSLPHHFKRLAVRWERRLNKTRT